MSRRHHCCCGGCGCGNRCCNQMYGNSFGYPGFLGGRGCGQMPFGGFGCTNPLILLLLLSSWC